MPHVHHHTPNTCHQAWHLIGANSITHEGGKEGKAALRLRHAPLPPSALFNPLSKVSGSWKIEFCPAVTRSASQEWSGIRLGNHITGKPTSRGPVTTTESWRLVASFHHQIPVGKRKPSPHPALCLTMEVGKGCWFSPCSKNLFNLSVSVVTFLNNKKKYTKEEKPKSCPS